jgi:hypothetical protein
MKAVKVQTVGQLARAERNANRDAIEAATRANPAHVAKKLLEDPTLLNGYAEAQVIVDVLHQQGQHDALHYLKDHRNCSARVRKFILNRLLFA